MPRAIASSMSSVRIERQGKGYQVHVTDPEIEKANQSDKGPWRDSVSEYNFDTWDQVKDFLDKVIEKALPADEFSRAFEDAAKEVTSGK